MNKTLKILILLILIILIKENLHSNYIRKNRYLKNAQSYWSKGNLKKAIRYFDKAVNQDLLDPDTFYLRGLCYLSAGELKQTIKNIKMAIKLGPARWEYRQIIVMLFCMEEDPTDLISEQYAIDCAQFLHSQNKPFLIQIPVAVVYKRCGYLDQAISICRKTIELYPGSSQIMLSIMKFFRDQPLKWRIREK